MAGDDAAGGSRGLRPAPSADLLLGVADAFGFAGVLEARDLGGSASLNLLVQHAGGRHVLRAHRRHVTEARLGAVQAARRALARAGLPVVEALRTTDGRPWLAHRGLLVEVEPYAVHDGRMDSWERLQIAIPLLARIHTVLEALEVGPQGGHPLFANHVQPEDAQRQTRAGTQRIRRWNDFPQAMELADAADELAERLSEAERDLATAIPRQLVHGDFWDNNVLFRDGRLALVADLDFMGRRARIDDLALTLYFAALAWGEACGSDGTVRRLRGLVEGYTSGLRTPLSPTEREALPLAILRQPLWSIGGWVSVLDDEDSARAHALATAPEVRWALRRVRDLDRWRAALA